MKFSLQINSVFSYSPQEENLNGLNVMIDGILHKVHATNESSPFGIDRMYCVTQLELKVSSLKSWSKKKSNSFLQGVAQYSLYKSIAGLFAALVMKRTKLNPS
jgi:hypothetical protein